MIFVPSDKAANAWTEDIRWFWSPWPKQFGQGLPLLLVGSPDTIFRQIETAIKRIPVHECSLLIPQGQQGRDRIFKSLDLFSSDVAPHFAS
jgi:hypothetical protein